MQGELQRERAELNLPPSRNVMPPMSVPGERLIAAKDVPSVFTAAAWDPLSPTIKTNRECARLFVPTHVTAVQATASGGTLAQVLGLVAPPPQPVEANPAAMSTNSFVQSITKMFVQPPPNVRSAPSPEHACSQMLGSGQGSVTVAPSVNANIAHPNVADDAHIASEMKRPRQQLTLRQGGLKRAFRKKPSMLGTKTRRTESANETPLKTRRRVDEWMENSTTFAPPIDVTPADGGEEIAAVDAVQVEPPHGDARNVAPE